MCFSMRSEAKRIGRFVVAEVLDKHLPQWLSGQGDGLFIDRGVRYLRVGTSNSMVRQAERGIRTISFRSLGERRRKVMKGMFILSSRARPA